MIRILCVTSLLIVAFSGQAQAESNPLQQAIKKCQQEQDSLKRLRCFDAIEQAKPVAETPSELQRTDSQTAPRVVPSRPATSATRATAPQQAAAAADDDFGKSAPKEQQKDRIYATVTLVEQEKSGHLVITFDNGHIWRQVNSQYYPIEEGETHYIRRAVLGSFLMGSDRNNRTTRVRRVD